MPKIELDIPQGMHLAITHIRVRRVKEGEEKAKRIIAETLSESERRWAQSWRVEPYEDTVLELIQRGIRAWGLDQAALTGKEPK